jgi:hypothetical protein
MERIATLLEKIRELNNKSSATVIDIDLMMDYTKVIYADLLEWRNRVMFNQAVTIGDKTTEDGVAKAMDENHREMESSPDISAPSVEPDTTSSGYETLHPAKDQSTISFITPRISDTDIRKQIGINDKYQFISELFGNNKEAYEEVVAELNSFDTEEDALDWLHKTVYLQYGWQDDMESVQALYRTIGHFYSTR